MLVSAGNSWSTLVKRDTSRSFILHPCSSHVKRIQSWCYISNTLCQYLWSSHVLKKTSLSSSIYGTPYDKKYQPWFWDHSIFWFILLVFLWDERQFYLVPLSLGLHVCSEEPASSLVYVGGMFTCWKWLIMVASVYTCSLYMCWEELVLSLVCIRSLLPFLREINLASVFTYGPSCIYRDQF